MDMNQYLDMFIEEAREHLQAINHHLLAFEKAPDNIGIVNEIFRSAHTLKGMAATMGYEDLASLTHEMENVLDLIRNHKLQANSDIIDIIFKSVDALENMVTSIIEKGDGKLDVTEIVAQLAAIVSGDLRVASADTPITPSIEDSKEKQTELHGSLLDSLKLDQFELTVLQQSLESSYHVYQIRVTISSNCVLKAARAYMVFDLLEKNGEVIKSTPSVEDIEEEKFDQYFDLIYVSQETADHLQNVILKVSEIQEVNVEEIQEASIKAKEEAVKREKVHREGEGVRESVAATVEETKSVPSQSVQNSENSAHVPARNVNRTIRVSIDRLDDLMNLFSELVIDRGRLEQVSKEVNNSELQETVEHMSRISGDLQSLILNMRMVPIEQVFNRFPRMVRGLAKDLNKKVDLQISGAETELDRTVIDEIGDPLVHLLRNAIDHGLETTEERRQNGKSEVGTIQLRAFHSGNHVFIEIIDDGHGINRDKILKRAIDKSIITEEHGKKLSDQEVYQLLFASGFSTAETISDISGRGVGLDVVKTKIESLGGVVSVQSELGKGTTFSIQLPLTLSIISAMLVQVEDQKYAIPLATIIETAVFKKEKIMSVHRQKVIDFRGKVVPLISLSEVFQIPVENEDDDDDVLSVVIVRKGEKMAGLIVDSFIGQQEVVLKSLGHYLGDIFSISGATILGDGQVALIIDCNALI